MFNSRLVRFLSFVPPQLLFLPPLLKKIAWIDLLADTDRATLRHSSELFSRPTPCSIVCIQETGGSEIQQVGVAGPPVVRDRTETGERVTISLSLSITVRSGFTSSSETLIYFLCGFMNIERC